MSFSYVPARKVSPEESSPWNNLLSNAMKNYETLTKSKYLEPNLQEALLKSKQYNEMYKPNVQSQIGLRGAQAGHLGAQTEGLNISNPYLARQLQQEQEKRQFELNHPFAKATDMAGQVQALQWGKSHPNEYGEQATNNPNMDEEDQRNADNERLRKEMDEQENIQNIKQGQNSLQEQIKSELDPKKLKEKVKPPQQDINKALEDYIIKKSQTAGKQYAPSNTVKDLQALKMAESGIDPTTGMPYESKASQKRDIDSLTEKVTGLKKGSHYIYDPDTHEEIGRERPLTQSETKIETGRAFFNEVYPKVYKGINQYMGKDSIKKLHSNAKNYGKDEEATRSIDDLILGEMLMSAATVNEAATLGAGKTNQTFTQLKKSLAKSDIPSKLEQYEKSFVIPNEAFMKASVRFQKILNSATENSLNSVPPTKIEYHHPEKYNNKKESEKESNNKEANKSYSDEDIKFTAEKYGISEDEVKKRLKRKSNGK